MRLTKLKLRKGDIIFRDGEFDILGLLPAKLDDKVVLSYFENIAYLDELENKSIGCVFCKEELIKYLPKSIKGIIISYNPKISFFELHNQLAREKRDIFKTAIGTGCQISPQAYISKNNVVIGNNVIIEEFVSIKENVKIEDNCIIRAGTIIGGEGYEFKRDDDGRLMNVIHTGGVWIKRNVEIQQLTNVAKAVFPWDNTVIGDGTKIDSLVHIAHCVKIENNSQIVAGAMVAGSTQIGNQVWIGPNSAISNGLQIADNARVSLGSVVTKNVECGKTVSGNFAIEHDIFIKNIKKSIKESITNKQN